MSNLGSALGKKSWTFIDHYFITCVGSLTAALTALSFLALPFTSTKHITIPEPAKNCLNIKARSNCLIMKKELQACPTDLRKTLIISQPSLFDPSNRYKHVRDEDGEEMKVEKEVEELVKGRVYGI